MEAALTSILAPAKNSTIIGVMSGDKSVDAVVIPTENGTSPWHRYDMIFDDTPPGQHPTRINPTAISLGSLKIVEIP